MLCSRDVKFAGQLSWQLGVVDSPSGCCIYGGASDPLPQRLLQLEKVLSDTVSQFYDESTTITTITWYS
jgi:hypothetical protein